MGEAAKLFARVCKDSGFKLDVVNAAKLTADVLSIHPLQVWIAVGSVATMERLADGTHPFYSREDRPQ